jgi:AP-1 complex subunit gamma-1
VRASKTIADERAVVQKESAAIRASFREESHNSDLRYDNMDNNKCMGMADETTQTE